MYMSVTPFMTRLAVGRIGDHQDSNSQNGLVYVTKSCLIDNDTIASLVGVLVDVNHTNRIIGKVVKADNYLVDGVHWCDAALTDEHFIAYLKEKKIQGISLETSPAFSSSHAIDPYGRETQYNRRYSRLSILTQGVAGNGGPEVFAQYNRSGDSKMDPTLADIMSKLAVLEGMLTAMSVKEEEEIEITPAMESEALAAKYSSGLADGKELKEVETKLAAYMLQKGKIFTPAETLDELLTVNLPLLGVKAGESQYMRGAYSVLCSSPAAKQEKEPTSNVTGDIRISHKNKFSA